MEQIACSLTPTRMAERLDAMAALGREALVDVVVHERRAELRFRPSARHRLDELVAAERECCSFLGLTVSADPLTLTIEAPPGAQPVLDELVGAFARA